MRYGFKLAHSLFQSLRGSLLTGVVVGLLSWASCSQFLMAWGAGLQAMTAIGIAVVLAASTQLAAGRLPRSVAPVWLATAAWWVVSPFVLTFTTGAGASILDAPLRSFVTIVSSALLFLTPGFALLARIVAGGSSGGRRVLLGAGMTWCLAPLTAGLWPGPQAAGLVAAAILLARFVRSMLAPTGLSCSVELRGAPGPISGPVAVALLPAVGAGAAIALIRWTSSQMFLPTAALWCAVWGGLLIGLSGGLRNFRPCDFLSRGARLCALLGVLVAVLAAAFPMLLQLAMTISATVSWLPAIVGLRTLIVAGLAYLPGRALGFSLAATGARPSDSSALRMLAVLAGFVGAFVAAGWLDLTVMTALPLAASCSIAAAGLWLWSARSSDVQSRLQWTTVPLGLLAVTAACIADPAGSLPGQRALFSGPHFQARAFGVSGELLTAIDDGRLLSAATTSQGVTCRWAHSGVQWVLRENGLTRGIVSTQPDLCPQPVPEVLSAVLPLTMHPRPHHILVTSASYPTVAATCLLFPVESVTAIDDNPAAIEFCRDAAERICPSLSRGDDRLRIRHADPVRGVATSDQVYDVIVCPNSIVGDLNSVRQWTVEHLREVAAHLSGDGIFCQRITCFDLNVPSVLELVRTAQSVFPVVQLHEVSAGEWLLVARPDAGDSLDKAFLERLEKPHVRDVLAQAGWDWSIILSLKTVHPGDLQGLAANAAWISTTDAGVAYRLPVDVMRWGPKLERRRQWIAQVARPLGDALGNEPALADVGQRLSDVTLAQQIMIDHPDQFAAYRHFVKKRLQDRPRPKVIQVDGEGLKNGLHPEDSRRKAYLSALGQAVETRSRQDIDRLIQFFSPFDPLIAPFIPREFIHIDRQSENPNVAAEWRCGLRSVFYAPPNDCSVNNACDALEILRSHPEVAGDASAQWDCCNALLEVLKNRWGLRIAAGASLKYGVADAHRTLELAAAALEQMDHLRSPAGISEAEWKPRRAVLEKHLMRPVRSWRTEQSAKFALQAATEAKPPVTPVVSTP